MSAFLAIDDPRAHLRPPGGTGCGQQINHIRTNAGVVIGTVDSIVSMIAGFSPLDEWVLKPLAGDWVAMDHAGEAWRNAGNALWAVSTNIDRLPDQVGDSWNGATKEEWSRLQHTIANALGPLPEAAKAMGDFADALAEMARAIGDFIASVLGIIADTVTRMLIQQAVPLVGQAVAAAEATVLVVRVAFYGGKISMTVAQFLKAVDMTIKIIGFILKIAALVESIVNALKAADSAIGAAGSTAAAGSTISNPAGVAV